MLVDHCNSAASRHTTNDDGTCRCGDWQASSQAQVVGTSVLQASGHGTGCTAVSDLPQWRCVVHGAVAAGCVLQSTSPTLENADGVLSASGHGTECAAVSDPSLWRCLMHGGVTAGCVLRLVRVVCRLWCVREGLAVLAHSVAQREPVCVRTQGIHRGGDKHVPVVAGQL